MEAVLPYDTKDKDSFYKCVCQLGFQEYEARKFIYIMQDSDLDVYQVMAEDRLSMLIYGWQLCYEHLQTLNLQPDDPLPASVQMAVKRLTYYSLDVWFSQEWERCKPARKCGLFYCLSRAKELMSKINNFSMLNWDYMLQFEMKPWRLEFLTKLFCTDMHKHSSKTNTGSIELLEEAVVGGDDIAYVKEEGVLLILFRLIKLIDAGSIEAAKYMSIRMIMTYNALHGKTKCAFNEIERRCLLLICHIYLMTLYELDDVRGFHIDNMMHNIRFYCTHMQNIRVRKQNDADSSSETKLTAAQHIATLCSLLHVSTNEFFEAFVFDKFDESFTTIFGVISHTYLSYLLGNMLNVMNDMNEEEFAQNLEKFKMILNFYVEERERSEQFTLSELQKINRQRRATTLSLTILKDKFCKGNRISNIGNYKIAGEMEEKPQTSGINLTNVEQARQIDPVFQSIPNNANILNYVYDVLAKRNYKGWHFAKVVLLLKIIGHGLNEIETWRYHPGLTTDFMMNLEIKLARHYADLAIIFDEHLFFAQEFWLTAFYLHPTCKKYYAQINRCGMRWNRKVKVANADANASGSGSGNAMHATPNANTSANEESAKVDVKLLDRGGATAKFGLFSSTIDVHSIVNLTNLEEPLSDYTALQEMLKSLHLPQNMIKDLLTVCFQRNKGFAWAVQWMDLHKRCKTLYKIPMRKSRLVELNMAEANDRLKFLKIDYNKYRNRPQLDYGAIEEGYEGTKYADCEVDSLEDDDDDDEDDNDDDAYESELGDSNRKSKEKDDKREEELLEESFVGMRRTRARAAAVIASAAIQRRIEENKKAEEQEKQQELEKQIAQANSEEEPADADKEEAKCEETVVKQSLSTWLEKHTTYSNPTEGFKPIVNIWDFDAKDVESIENDSTCFTEDKTRCINDRLKQLLKAREVAAAAAAAQKKSRTPSPAVTEASEASDESINVARNSFAGDKYEAAADLIRIPLKTSDSNSSDLNASENDVPENSNDRQTINEKKTNIIIDDSYPEHLVKQCLLNQMTVLVNRLTVAEMAQLRQPKVFIRRITMEVTSLKRKRRPSKRVCTDCDMSCSSEHYRYHLAKRPRKMAPKSKRRIYLQQQLYGSDTSTASDECKAKKPPSLKSNPVEIATATSTTIDVPTAAGDTGTTATDAVTGIQQNLSTIRNATSDGLIKIPTSSSSPLSSSSSENCVPVAVAKMLPQKNGRPIDYIQISSSSASPASVQAIGSPVFLTAAMPEEINMDDPLYEEEIII